MSEEAKITLQINPLNGEIFKVEIDSDSTVLQLTKEVAKKVLELKDQYPCGFVLVFCGHIINVRILKDEKITSIPVFDHLKKCVLPYEPLVISNKDTIHIVWRNQESDIYFSWDAMEEKSIEIETVQNEKKIISKKDTHYVSNKIETIESNQELGKEKEKSDTTRKIDLSNANKFSNNEEYGNNTFVSNQITKDKSITNTDLNLISQGKGKWLQQLLKKILLVIDVVCAGSATITFALPFLTNLSVPIVWPIVFATLFVTCAVLFLGFEKIFPKRWIEYPMLKIDFDKNDKSRYENQIGIEPNRRSIEKNYSEIRDV